MALIIPLNLESQKNKKMTEFKPIMSKSINDQEYKLTFQSNRGGNTSCEFTFNATLMNDINIKVGDKEYDIYKVPYYGIKVNFNTSEGDLVISMKPKDFCSKISVWDVKERGSYEYVDITWDKIYIINLKRRPERRENMTMHLEELGIQNYEFIEAVDSQDEAVLKEYEDLKKEDKTIIVSAGHYGCLKSHIKALFKARREKVENIMILEDDAIFDNDFFEKIAETKVPKYDMLYLGGLTRSIKLFFNGWGTGKEIMGTYGYILNKSQYNKVIVGMSKSNIYSDTYYLNNIQGKDDIKTYIVSDFIKTTIETTDTSNKNSVAVKPLEYINNSKKYYSVK